MSSRQDRLLRPAEVAAMFRVDPRTVTRWSQAGRISAVRTLGGHRRYRASEVYALLEATEPTPPAQPAPTGELATDIDAIVRGTP